VDGSVPELRETEHFYMDLSKQEPDVVEFLRARSGYMRDTVLGESLRKIEAEGLKPRPITRDLDWGIPVPVEGWDEKRLYVWFEAVIGYLSATIELTSLQGADSDWQTWWQNPDAKAYYFIGKDNIPFHAYIWPAQLIGCGTAFGRLVGSPLDAPLTLPYDVPANEFMNLEGQKISGSRNWAVWGLDFLSRYDPDPLRYYLTVTMPETSDSDWDWNDFFHRNNDELVATWGNLANRVLSFAYKHWEGRVPEPGELRPEDQALLDTINAGFESVADQFEGVHMRAALKEAMRLASEVNKYLDQTAPWFQIKTDKAAAGRSIFTALRAIDSLKIMLAPFLPHSSEKLHTYLGYTQPLFGTQSVEVENDSLGEHSVLRYHAENASGRWEPSQLKAGDVINPPLPLFKKLDVSIVEEERKRLG
jgi:methionyl-tRNA synthetase